MKYSTTLYRSSSVLNEGYPIFISQKIFIFNRNCHCNHVFPCKTSIRYSTIETKEAARIGYNGFLFPHEYSGEGRGA